MDEEWILTLLFIAVCYVAALKLPKLKMPVDPVSLGPGSYTVDEDLEPGKYDLTATEGVGDFCVKQKDSDDWAYTNPLCANSPLQADRFRNVDLKKGDTLEINCNVTVSVTAASAIKDVEKETLHPGIYRIAADLPPGKYSLEVVSGSGYVFMTEKNKKDYVFFQYMAQSHHLKAPRYANLHCIKDHELWVMGSLELRLTKESDK